MKYYNPLVDKKELIINERIAMNQEGTEKELCISDVIKSVCECGSTKFNITVKDKPFCFLCGKDARQTVL